MAELPEPDLATALSRLRDAELLSEEALYPDVEYAFRHPLTQSVAYDSQRTQTREYVHAAVAQALEELDADKLGQ